MFSLLGGLNFAQVYRTYEGTDKFALRIGLSAVRALIDHVSRSLTKAWVQPRF